MVFFTYIGMYFVGCIISATLVSMFLDHINR